jgi:hypothetical protein
MKKLIFLISTEGKTRELIVKETWEAFQKYNKVESGLRKIGKTKDSKAT